MLWRISPPWRVQTDNNYQPYFTIPPFFGEPVLPPLSKNPYRLQNKVFSFQLKEKNCYCFPVFRLLVRREKREAIARHEQYILMLYTGNRLSFIPQGKAARGNFPSEFFLQAAAAASLQSNLFSYRLVAFTDAARATPAPCPCRWPRRELWPPRCNFPPSGFLRGP
jgi:hypothetical protein